MRSVSFVILSSLFALLSFAETVRLDSGIARRFSLPSQDQPVLVTGISVPVPAGSTRLTIDLDTDPTENQTLFARFNQDLVPQGGGVNFADFTSHVPGTHQQIVISRDTSPPL